jgi:DNA invertase Pin-like site-specific DNA recombinase
MMNTLRQAAKINNTRITALYERLSVDDALDGTSNSIVNQRQILEDFANKSGFTNIQHFSDDGFSGTNWERPGWKALISEVEAGNVGVIIVKDMSRVGRDYLQVGFYTEVMFRKHGVRFIAVSNNIDSDNKESAEFAPFLNLMSEWYARDCSRKIKTVLHAKGNSGKPMTNTPIYGYKRHPDDKNEWIVDEEAAAIVRRIFQMTMDGFTLSQIGRTLHSEKILRVSCYLTKTFPKKLTEQTLANPYAWDAGTIADILEKPEYAGHTVNFKTYKESYKERSCKRNDKANWKIFHNTHEPLVSQEVFDTVQRLRETKRRTNKWGEANPFTGIVYCADCGEKMYNQRPHPRCSDNYSCSTYRNSHKLFNVKCTTHYIRTAVLQELILDTIRQVCGYVRQNQAEFVRRVREEAILQNGEAAKSHKKLIAKNERRIIELDMLFKKAFESNANGKLNDKRFEQMTADYEAEQAELETKNAEMQSELDAFNADSGNVDNFIGIVKRYTEFEVLTTPMLNEFVNKIYVYDSTKNEWGERVQRVDIHFNFIGNFAVPIEEVALTPEEEAELNELRHKRMKSREYNERYYAKKKAKLEQEKAEKSA